MSVEFQLLHNGIDAVRNQANEKKKWQSSEG